MAWPDNVIWWHVYPLGFTGAHPDTEKSSTGSGGAADPTNAPVRRLDALIPWLNYVGELGCSGLLLGPIFESGSHGYDTTDYFRIDARLGDQGDFDGLVAAAKERGLRVLLDGVFNHVGGGFAQLREALCRGPESEAAQWFRRQPAPVEPGGSRQHSPGDSDFAVFEGHSDLVVFNHDNPAVADFIGDVMCHWLDKGADGWRLDAAYAVPAPFWRPVLRRVRRHHPEAWFVAEMIHGDYSNYTAASTIDSTTQYELWKAIWSSLNDGNFFELAWALERHESYADSFLPLTFVGNHDVTRIASRLDDPGLLGHALVTLFSVAGAPSIYYGDEQGFRGVKEEAFGGDDAVRPPFPSSPRQLAPWGEPVFETHRRLIQMRREHPWLARCRTEVVSLTNTTLALRSTPRGTGEATVLVLLNVGDEPSHFDVELGRLTRWLTGPSENSDDDPTTVVPARGWAVFASV